MLFLFLIVVSLFFVFRKNDFQRSKYLAAFEEIAGYVYTISNSFQSYINLRSANSELLSKVAQLEMELQVYQSNRSDSVRFPISDPDMKTLIEDVRYKYIPARVINNQISGIDNYITLNKGSLDGVKPDMGVRSVNGIVGVVVRVSPNFSRVISVLNPKFRPNCKIKRNNYSGPLLWDGEDIQYTYLEELPRHMSFEIGDTIVSSGFSTIFPEGIPVGTIVASEKDRSDDYHSLKVKLFTNFANLKDVLIVENILQQEQLMLEGAASNNE